MSAYAQKWPNSVRDAQSELIFTEQAEVSPTVSE